MRFVDSGDPNRRLVVHTCNSLRMFRVAGSIMFHVRRRPADYHPRKRKKKPQQKWNQHQANSNELLEYRYEDGSDRLPLFLELNPGECFTLTRLVSSVLFEKLSRRVIIFS